MVSVGKLRSNRGGSHSSWVKIGNKTFENRSIGYKIQALNTAYEYGINNALKRYSIAYAKYINSSCKANVENCPYTKTSDACHLALLGNADSKINVYIDGCYNNCCPQMVCNSNSNGTGAGTHICVDYAIYPNNDYRNKPWQWNYDTKNAGGITVGYKGYNANLCSYITDTVQNNCCNGRCVSGTSTTNPQCLAGTYNCTLNKC
jgi:hypothetical protein